MRTNGFLSYTCMYTFIADTHKIIDAYYEALDPIFARINDFENGGADVMKFLDGPICQTGFARLN